jgi:hypothetical protein
MGQAPTTENRKFKRPRVIVTSHHTPVSQGEVASIRQQHARQITSGDDAEMFEDNAPIQFNPRKMGASPIPEMEMPQGKPTATMEDVTAAFARAGQKMKVEPQRRPRINPTPQVQESPPEVEFNTHRVTKPIGKIEDGYRVFLPSNNIFYEYPDLEMRQFDVPDLAVLFRAREEQDETLLIDAVAGTASVDVRDLTPADFRYLLYQHRLHDYLAHPYELTYTSFYGNRNTVTITKTNLRINMLKATKEEYAEALAKGLCIMTVRDQEEFNSLKPTLGPDADFYWSYAKHLQGETVRDKIDKIKSKKVTPDFLFGEVVPFGKKFDDYGVIETIEIQDEKFDAEKAIAKLATEITEATAVLNNSAISVAVADRIFARIGVMQTELDRINTELQTGEAAPKSETISFSIEIADFFPVIQ